MLYQHKDHLINLDEIEVAFLGRDSAKLYMTNGDAINFLTGSEELIAVLNNMQAIHANNKLFFVSNISKVKCTDSMALIQMKSGYQETIRGEEAMKQIASFAGEVLPKGYAPPRQKRPDMTPHHRGVTSHNPPMMGGNRGVIDKKRMREEGNE
jgi:hypothetical protein